jgi:D-alanine-D-alanine ligase
MVGRDELYAHDPLPRPYVLKPINEGSSVGVAIVTDQSNYGNPIRADAAGPWQQFERLLAEPFIRGLELTTAVLGDRALCVTELKPKAGFYDFDSKYTDGLTEHVCPAQIPDDVTQACLDIALAAHRLLGCRGTSRADFRWDDQRGIAGLFLLEINTQPGMTPLSLVPEQARFCGMDYGDLVEAIIADALDRNEAAGRAGMPLASEGAAR